MHTSIRPSTYAYTYMHAYMHAYMPPQTLETRNESPLHQYNLPLNPDP